MGNASSTNALPSFWIPVLGILVTIGILLGIRLFTDYLKYKDEPPEQRTERLKTEEMIKEWQKRYY